MKTVTSILLAISPLFCLAQPKTLHGIVKDIETGKAIRGAYVYLPLSDTGTATNAKGEFELKVGLHNDHELVVTAIPYEPYKSSISSFSDRPREIHLMPQAPDVTKRKSSAETLALIIEAVNKFSSNYDSTSSGTTFYRESVQSFGNIIQYMEVLFRSGDTPEVVNAMYMEDSHQRDEFWSQESGGFYTFSLTEFVKSQEPSKHFFLGAHLKAPHEISKYYSFVSRGTIVFGENTIHVVDFDQQPIKGSFLKGTLYIDDQSKAITKIKYELSPRGLQYTLPNRTIGGIRICKPPLHIEIIRHDGELNFRNHGAGWNLSNSFSNLQFCTSFDSIVSKPQEKQYLKMHNETVVIHYAPGQTKRRNIEFYREANVNHRFIKNNFTRYWSSDLFSDIPVIKMDTTVSSVSQKFARINTAWERNAARKAREHLTLSTRLTVDQQLEDLKYLTELLVAVHPVHYDHTSKSQFELLSQNIQKRINRSNSETEFHRLLVPLIQNIYCSHTTILPSDRTEAYNKSFGKYFPGDVRIVGRRLFWDRAADTTSMDEIVRINGVPATRILQTLQDKIPTEGKHHQQHDYQLSKNFSTLYAFYFDHPDTFLVEFRDLQHKNILSEKVVSIRDRAPGLSSDPTFKEIDSLQSAILAIPSFSCKQLPEFLSNAFTTIRKKGVSNLIIDLRDNAGLNDTIGPLLYSYAASEPFKFYDRVEANTADISIWKKISVGKTPLPEKYRMFTSGLHVTDSMITYNDHPNLRTHNTGSPSFGGNIFILVNEGTLSTAAEFANFAALQHRATIIGSEISSNAHGCGNMETGFVVLPNSKLQVTLPLTRYRLAGQTKNQAPRLMPDYSIVPSVEEIVSREDVAMKTAINLIIQSCCSAKSN